MFERNLFKFMFVTSFVMFMHGMRFCLDLTIISIIIILRKMIPHEKLIYNFIKKKCVSWNFIVLSENEYLAILFERTSKYASELRPHFTTIGEHFCKGQLGFSSFGKNGILKVTNKNKLRKMNIHQ